MRVSDLFSSAIALSAGLFSRRNRVALGAIIVLGIWLPGAQAAVISVDGDDVTFTYDNSGLFGVGNVVGNSIFFSPTAFKAEALNLAGVVTANETLNITVDVRPESAGFEITSFLVAELGDYLLDGDDVSVDASGRLQVLSQTMTCGVFACLDSEIFAAGNLTAQGTLTEWTAGTTIDLADTAGWGSDTSVIAQIQNDLTARSVVNGEQAFIQKKGEGIGLIVNPVVPVPAAGWLFGSALAVFGWMRKFGRRSDGFRSA